MAPRLIIADILSNRLIKEMLVSDQQTLGREADMRRRRDDSEEFIRKKNKINPNQGK